MAQVVKLKRTSVQGRVPNIANLELGELAINTHDGRIFFEKDNGELSIQEILTTNSSNSGSFNLQGAISASSLSISGDTTIGGNLTLGGNITIGDETTDSINISAEFSGSLLPDGNEVYDLGSSSKKWNNIWVKDVNATSIASTNNSTDTLQIKSSGVVRGTISGDGDGMYISAVNGLGLYTADGTDGVVIASNGDTTIYGSIQLQTIPLEATAVNALVVGVGNKVSYRPLGSNAFSSENFLSVNGDSVVSGSSQLTSSFDSRYLNVSGEGSISGSFTGSFNGDGSGLTNITVDAAATVSYTFTNESIITVSHNFNTRNILVAVYDNQNNQVLPQNVNTSNLDQVVITLSSAQSGVVVVAKGGHIISGSAGDSNKLGGKLPSAYATTGSNQFQDNQEITGSLNVSGGITGSVSYTNLTDLPTLISGSTQITDGSNIVSGSTQITDGSGLLSSSNEDFNTFSSSIDLRTDSLESFSSSFDTAINLDSTNVTILGNLTVQGTTTTINTSTFNVEDNIIELNYGGSATEGGIFVKDSTGGSTTSGSLLWDATNDYWKAGTSGSESEIITTSNIVTNLPTGTISGSEQLPSGTVSGSTQITNGSGLLSSSNEDFSTFSSSVDNRLDQLETNSGSQDSRLDNLESFTSSLSTTESTYSGSFSGSFVGDGSGLTGIQVDQIASVTASFSEQSTINVSHNFGTYNVIVSTYDSNYNQLIPQTVSLTDTNTVQVVLSNSGSGHVVVAKGGHIVSGVYVDDVTVLSDNFTNETLYTVNHLFNTKDVIVTVYGTNDAQIIPQSIVTSTLNTVEIGFENSTSGRVVVAKAGHVVSGSTALVHNTKDDTTMSFWYGSQSEYDEIGSYDSSTLYFVS